MNNAFDFLRDYLAPAAGRVAAFPGWHAPFSGPAMVQLLAMAGQETGWRNIEQIGGGPGRGPWQFEPETCAELLASKATGEMLHTLCRMIYLQPTGPVIYQRIMGSPDLAAGLARLDLWANPRALPAIGDEEAAWETYVRVWRPGAVTEGGQRAVEARERWSAVYPQAVAAWTAYEKTHQEPPPANPTAPAAPGHNSRFAMVAEAPPSAPPLVSSSPANQATAAGSYTAAGALVVILVWLLGLFHVVVPSDVVGAFGVLLGIGVHALVVKFGLST
jgi:hypothetical protein